MKALTATLIGLIIVSFVSAKTYIIDSGKWTDTRIWAGQYPGTTIHADDVVIIKGQVTLTTPIIIEGTLQVEKGACLIGMQTLLIAKTGLFINNGNTVTKQIVNEGSITNNLMMESKGDADNLGNIDNDNLFTSGHDFNNMRGTAAGNGGVYVADNNINSAPEATFGTNVKFLVGGETENKASNGTMNR